MNATVHHLDADETEALVKLGRLATSIRKPGEVGCVCCSTVLPSLADYMAHPCERVAA